MQDLAKATSLRRMAESKTEMATAFDTFQQELDAGGIAPEKAQEAWQERAKKIIDARMEGVGLLQRDVVAAQLEGMGADYGIRARQAGTKKTQDNIGGELVALGNALEREPDPAAAATRYEQSVRAMGPSAGWTPAQIETQINGFRERAYATQAYSLVNGARNNMAALNEVERRLQSDEFGALDPQRRAVLLNTTAGYKTSLEQRALAAAQRAEIAAAKRDREAGVLFGQVQALTTEGKIISPEYIAQVAPKLMGTPYEAAFNAAVKQAPEGTAFAMQPLSVQRAVLDRLEAEGNSKGWTPELADRADTLKKSYEASQREYKEDPLRAAVARGVLAELEPLDLSGGAQSLLLSISGRVDQASQVEQVTGIPTSPLTPDEAGQVATLLSPLPVDQKATTMAKLSAALGPGKMGALAAQIDQKNPTLALAAAYGNTLQSNGGLVSERLIRGQQAIDDKRVQPADVSMWRSEIAEQVRGAYATPEMEDSIIEAAVLARADAEINGGPRRLSKVLEDVAGSIVEFNGGRIPLPMGMTESQFERSIESMKPDALTSQAPDGNVYVQGNAVPLADFLKSLPDASLRHAGQGRYTVSAGAGFVLNQAGQPIVIEVSNGTR